MVTFDHVTPIVAPLAPNRSPFSFQGAGIVIYKVPFGTRVLEELSFLIWSGLDTMCSRLGKFLTETT